MTPKLNASIIEAQTAELDTAVINTQRLYDRLGTVMTELERLHANRCPSARIGLAALEAEALGSLLLDGLSTVILFSDPDHDIGKVEILPAEPFLPSSERSAA